MTTNDRPEAIIMDLDGTLCDGSAFLKLGDHAYHEAATTVAPVNAAMARVCDDAVKAGQLVIIVTGRSSVWESAGKVWLSDHHITFHGFWSRQRGDYRPNAEIKRQVTKHLLRTVDIVRAYDDDPRNIMMFERLGIHAVQVGDFDWRLA